MAEGFVALAVLLRGGVASPRIDVARVTTAPPVAIEAAAAPLPTGALGELARLRLAAHDAFAQAVARALEGFARDVLARELSLAPADVRALVERALAAFGAHEPLAVRLSPGDAAAVTTSLPVRIDASLARGDVVVDVAGGAFESPLAFRLRSVVEEAAAFATAATERA